MGIFCQIRLNRPPNGIFTPNSLVSGRIKYALDADMSIEGITVSLIGGGVVHIIEGLGRTQREYKNNEIYCKMSDVIHDAHQGNVIKSGSYEVTFKFVLPSDIPASFEYRKHSLMLFVQCNLAYFISIHFKRPKFNVDKNFNQEFIVVRDTRTIPRHPTQLIVYGEKKKISRIFSNGVIYAKVFVPNSVIVPGGKIRLDCEVINESKINVQGVEVKLREELRFFTERRKLPLQFDIPNTTHWIGAVASGHSEKTHVSIEIPNQYLSFDFSKIFRRDFEVKVMLDLPSPHSNFYVTVPFQIGNLATEDNPSHTEAIEDDVQDDLDPPSYWAAMNESQLIDV